MMKKTKIKRKIIQTRLFNICYHYQIRGFLRTPSKVKFNKTIDLVKVFDAILTSRRTREKLQCLYENLMSNNFRGTAVLKKI